MDLEDRLPHELNDVLGVLPQHELPEARLGPGLRQADQCLQLPGCDGDPVRSSPAACRSTLATGRLVQAGGG